MISSLRGKVTKIYGNYVEVEVAGVGYWLYIGNNLARKINEGQEIKLQTYMAVSEKDISLYGFESWEDLNLFKLLITVSGVGPKTGAQILGNSTSTEIIKAIGDADVEFFGKIKGIGKKTAQRIIVDLKSKIGGLGELNLREELPLLDDDLVASMRQLGFERKEIDKVIKKLPSELKVLEEKLQWCLQNMGG
jgi:Holliday junction DNA helicase RuvA